MTTEDRLKNLLFKLYWVMDDKPHQMWVSAIEAAKEIQERTGDDYSEEIRYFEKMYETPGKKYLNFKALNDIRNEVNNERV